MDYNLSPGHILQFNHLKRQLRFNPKETFIEIGSGNGIVSRVLLDFGMKGIGFDLNASACKNNEYLNEKFIASGKYRIFNNDFVTSSLDEKSDIIVSCMVIEHFSDETLILLFEKIKAHLKPDGMIITLVPGSSRHWGIEDEIAGHYKRYSQKDFEQIASKHGLRSTYTSGLTYPLSNILLPLSNFLVNRKENKKLTKTLQERTVDSGNRNVAFKTTFPWYFKFLINEVTLLPFILIQRIFSRSPNCLVIYNEMRLP